MFLAVLFVVLAAAAIASAVIARRASRCAVEAAATALAAVGPHRSRFRVDAASSATPAPELFHCRHCSQLIEATPDGYSVPFVHLATRAAACAVDISHPFVCWAEPALPDRWLGDVEPGDLTAEPPTAIGAFPVYTAPEPVDDGRPRCRHDGRPIMPNPTAGDVGHPWRHVDGGPACWWHGDDHRPELFGKYAMPEHSAAIGSRPPLSLIPAPVDAIGGVL